MPEKTTSHFTKVIKRDGRRVHFEKEKITNAIFKAIKSTGEGKEKDAEKLSNLVIAELNRRYPPVHTPHIEEIQDVVEEIFITKDYAKTAKAYILYRNERAQIRAQKRLVPEHVQKLVAESGGVYNPYLFEGGVQDAVRKAPVRFRAEDADNSVPSPQPGHLPHPHP